MNNLYPIVLKTVATTIDMIIGGIVMLAKGNDNKMKIAYWVFAIINLVGIWC